MLQQAILTAVRRWIRARAFV